MGGTRLLSEKTEALQAQLNGKVEATTSSYSSAVHFFQYIYSVLCLWLRIVRRSDQGVYLVHEISFTDFF